MHAKRLFEKTKLSITQLNLIDKRSQNPLRIHRARIATRLYIIAVTIAVAVIIFHMSLTKQTFREKIEFPTEKQYEELSEKYPDTVKCPCTTISIPYQAFIEVKPTYHQLCESDFVQPSWYSEMILSDWYFYVFPDNFLNTAPSFFQALGTFCSLVNLTVNAAIRRFHSHDFVNDKILSRTLFQSHMDSLIYSFFNSTRIKFLYTMAVVNAIIHTNQYVSGLMTNLRMTTQNIPELEDYGFDPVTVIASNIFRNSQNSNWCSCGEDLDCYSVISLPLQSAFESYGLVTACYTVQTALQSSLRCWYNTSCINVVQHNFELYSTSHRTPLMVSALNSTYPSRFSSNDNLKLVLDELMVESWNFFAKYDQYYHKCEPVYCSFDYTEKASVIYMVTTIIGLFGGLNIVFRLISIAVVRIFVKNVKVTTSDNSISAHVSNSITRSESNVANN